MKKLCVVLCLALLLACAVAQAENETPDAELTALLGEAYPGYAVAAFDAWGDTASAVMSANGRNILCVAEKQGGAWALTVESPAALRQGAEVPTLLQDTDTVLFWTYRQGNVVTTYTANRLADGWQADALSRYEALDNGRSYETAVYWDSVHGGALWCRRYYCDENGNILSSSESAPIPARWVSATVSLTAFDASVFPAFEETEHEYAWQDLLQKAAAELLPSDVFLGGTLGWNGDGIELWVKKPSGERVLVGCHYDGGTPNGWMLTESAPLPEGTSYGYENFSSSLCIGERVLVDVGPYPNGAWGVVSVMSLETGDQFSLGPDWIADNLDWQGRVAFGAHPWGDIATIDWGSLPGSWSEALAALDTANRAVVNNPNPADRLHLRASPQKDAPSLGKYYNGTPVRVLRQEGDWAQVELCGVEGWMMARYLAFGGEVANTAFPHLWSRNDVALRRSVADDTALAYTRKGEELLVLGIVGEEWYHVRLIESGATGYVRQTEVTPGNG